MTEREKLARLIEGAAGRRPADLLIVNCRLADVFSQTWFDGPLALGDGLILGWGEGYEAAETLDAQGGFVLPGFIDGHVHIESSGLTPPRFAEAVLPLGSTSIVADPHEIANVLGAAGLEYMLESTRGLPLNVFLMLPSCVPASPFEEAGAGLSAADLAGWLGRPGVLGLGEVMNYPGVVDAEPEVLDKLVLARKAGLVMDGHSPGLSGRRLSAYTAAGLGSDHECTTPEETLERLRRGQYVLLREGSASRDLLNLLPAVSPANLRRCLFCSDDREPADILARGHMDNHLRLAVGAGLAPLAAVAMATLNAAECYGLKGKGALAPGFDADLVVVEDLKGFKARHVFSRGREVARDGRLLVKMESRPPETVLNSVRLAPLKEDSFALPLKSGRVLAIEALPDSLLTRRLETSVRRDAAGRFDARLNPGLNKVAIIERHRASGRLGLGVLAGYGLKRGALASSVAHDAHNLIVAGVDDADMLAAARAVAELGGGVALVREGRLLASLALPAAGLMADRAAADAAEDWVRLLAAARAELGFPAGIHPIQTLSFLSLTVIPELRLTCGGLFDALAFRPTALEI